MGKSSQRKGRAGEFEIARVLEAAGWNCIVKDIWQPLDITWDGDDCEVKRRKDGMGFAYEAFANDAGAVFFRRDRDEWLVIHTLNDYIRKHGPEIVEPSQYIPNGEEE